MDYTYPEMESSRVWLCVDIIIPMKTPELQHVETMFKKLLEEIRKINARLDTIMESVRSIESGR